ncbi:hypothetical protein ACLIJR_18155 [Hydrogenophaga sp. XSHU_21]
MRREDIDPKEFNACIAEALDYVAVKLVELNVPPNIGEVTRIRADIEEFTMLAFAACIMPSTPPKWRWQMAARLISKEVAKQHVCGFENQYGAKGSSPTGGQLPRAPE